MMLMRDGHHLPCVIFLRHTSSLGAMGLLPADTHRLGGVLVAFLFWRFGCGSCEGHSHSSCPAHILQTPSSLSKQDPTVTLGERGFRK
jgi:hypothetical protein